MADPSTPYGSIDNVYFRNITIGAPTGGNYVWGHEGSSQASNVIFENLVVNGQVIREPGDADIDVNEYAHGIKCVAKNYVENWSFEADPEGSATIQGWTSVGDAQNVSICGPGCGYLGNGAGAHEGASPYRVVTSQTITDHANGTYTAVAWVKSSGAQDESSFSVSDHGGSEMQVVLPSAPQTWTEVRLPSVEVTSGRCTLSFSSDANASDFMFFDNVQLYETVTEIE